MATAQENANLPAMSVNIGDMTTKLAGEDLTNDVLKVEEQYKYNYIVTAATTLVKNTSGILHSITINKPVAAGIIEVYDAITAAAPTIAIITRAATLLTDGPVTLLYDVKFNTGLTIKTTETQNITVSYR